MITSNRGWRAKVLKHTNELARHVECKVSDGQDEEEKNQYESPWPLAEPAEHGRRVWQRPWLALLLAKQVDLVSFERSGVAPIISLLSFWITREQTETRRAR